MPDTVGGREVGGSDTGGEDENGMRGPGKVTSFLQASAAGVQPGDAGGQEGPPQASGREGPVGMHTVTWGPERLRLILKIWLTVAGEDWGGGENFNFLHQMASL